MSTSAFDPYHRWLGIPPKDQPPHHYRLLAIDLYENDPDVISTAADQRMVHLKTFQGGANSSLSQRLLNEIAAARVCLLNADQKVTYDAQRRAALRARKSGAAPSRVIAQAKSIAHQASAEVSGTADLEALVAGIPTDFRSTSGNSKRKRKSGSKQAGWTGPGKYPLAVLGVGVVALGVMLWVRANNWQIQLVDTDQAVATSKAPSRQPSQQSAGDRPLHGENPAIAKDDRRTQSHDPRALRSGAPNTIVSKRSDNPPIDESPPTASSPAAATAVNPNTSAASPESNWVELVPTEMASSNRATLELQPDHSIVALSSNSVGSYTIKATTHLTEITGFRLEALTDARLPCTGPGRSTGGNFILSEFNVTATSLADPAKTTTIGLHNVRADFDQAAWPSTAILDGNPDTGWGVYPKTGQNHVAVFETREPVGFAGGTMLTIVLDQQHPGAQLGRFRLAVTTATHSPDPAASVTPNNIDLKSRDLSSPVPTGEYEAQTWRYTLDRPADGWEQPEFRDLAWSDGAAPFGQSEFLTARTLWNTSDIWLRREFELADDQPVPTATRILHDEEVEVYINGVLALQLGGFIGGYLEYEIHPALRRAFKAGRNVLAVHCHQNSGGQFIDVGLLNLSPGPKFRPFTDVKTVRGKSIDLLRLIDPERDSVRGQWSFAGEVLSSPAGGLVSLQIPYAPPFEYKLTIIGERESGTDLMIGLVVAGRRAIVVLDGWNGTATGLAGVDGKDANANPTTKQIANVLGNHREYKIFCNVRGHHIDVQLNGAPLINWPGSPEGYSIGPEWTMPMRDQLFIGAYNAVHHIKSITLIPKSSAPSGSPTKAGKR